MRVHPDALKRVADSRMHGEGAAKILTMLAQAAMLAPERANLSFSMGFQSPEDKFLPTDLFPVITLSLVPPSEISTVDGSNPQTGNGPTQGTTGDKPVP